MKMSVPEAGEESALSTSDEKGEPTIFKHYVSVLYITKKKKENTGKFSTFVPSPFSRRPFWRHVMLDF